MKNIGKFKFLVLAMALIDTLAWVFYALALNLNDLAITTAITESYPAVAIFLAFWINKERIGLHQGIGAVIALAASVALILV